MSTKVLFHSNGNGKHCPDGFAAAWVAWTRFGDEAQYIPCVYGQDAPAVDAGDTVFLVDFSYPRDVLLDMASRATVVVLDHHKTAQAALEGLPFAHFDMSKSGAQLAWEYWHPTEVEPLLISYVADRDLWTKALPYTEEVHRALASFIQDFKVWDTLASFRDYVGFMVALGAPLYELHQGKVRTAAQSAEWVDFAGHRVLALNTNNYSIVSDALNLICKEIPDTPFALNYWRNGDGKTKVELRSVGDFDVSEIAKRFGGGGHKNAAGCEVVGGI